MTCLLITKFTMFWIGCIRASILFIIPFLRQKHCCIDSIFYWFVKYLSPTKKLNYFSLFVEKEKGQDKYMTEYIYTVVITENFGGNKVGNNKPLPCAYTSYEAALAALNKEINRPWQGHELFLESQFRKDWNKIWDSLPDEKRNFVEEGSKFYDDNDDENITQIPIEAYLFANIYRLRPLKI